MRFIGVDLGWSTGATGLCVAAHGEIVDSALARSDEEVIAWLLPYNRGPRLVAFDAPLVVPNATGRRPCEGAISRCFARYEAGTHPSNLGRPGFERGPRAARLARRLGLSVDPAFRPLAPVRRAIEVYPHAATVALFDLPVTLKYKAGRGRTPEGRRRAFAALVAHVEALASARPALDVTSSPRWEELRREATSGRTQVALDRAEDEMDAYLCAYVALYFWTWGSRRCRVVGDTTAGYIVTPVTRQQADCLDRQLDAAGDLLSVSERAHGPNQLRC